MGTPLKTLKTTVGMGDSANERAFLYLDAPAAPGLAGKPELLAFEGVEGLSSLFEFELTIRCPDSWLRHQSWFEALVESWLGRSIGFGLRQRENADFHGMVCWLSEESPETFKVVVRPELTLLQQSVTFQCLHRVSADQAVSKVLERAEIKEVCWRLSPQHRPVREAYLQIAESDFEFVSRVLAEAGMVYFFRHSRGAHTLEITDSTPMLAGPGVRRLTLRSGRPEPGAPPAVTSWRREASMIPGGVTATWFNPKSPDAPLVVSSATSGASPATRARLVELGPIQGEARADIQRVASDLSDGLSAQRNRVHAMATVCLHAGEVVVPGDAGEPHLVRLVRHGAVEASPSRPGGYGCAVECQRASVAYRPPVPHVPARWGTFKAVVCDERGEFRERPGRTVLDAKGRAYIRFRWDGATGATGAAIPAMLANSGSFASLSPPLVGQEVVVFFEHAAPDMPVIFAQRRENSMDLPHDLARHPAMHSFCIPASPAGKDRADTLIQVNPDPAAPVAIASLPGSLIARVARAVSMSVRKVFRVDAEEILALRGKKQVVIEGGEISLISGGSTLVITPNGISIMSGQLYLNSPGGPSPALFPTSSEA